MRWIGRKVFFGVSALFIVYLISQSSWIPDDNDSHIDGSAVEQRKDDESDKLHYLFYEDEITTEPPEKKEVFCALPPDPTWDTFYAYIKEVHPCKLTYSFGGMVKRYGIFEGHKMVCMDGVFRPVKQHCNVLSIGISTDWSFDDAFDNYGCQVYAFDPTIEKKTFDRSKNIHFFPIGLSNRNSKNSKQQQFMTYRNILKKLKLEGEIIDYIKIDIEGAELPVMEQLLTQEQDLIRNVKQIAIEFHPTRAQAARNKAYEIMHMLSCMKFKLIYSEKNPLNLFPYKNGTESCCYEMVWINEGSAAVESFKVKSLKDTKLLQVSKVNRKSNNINDDSQKESLRAAKPVNRSLQNVTCEYSRNITWDVFYSYIKKTEPCLLTYSFGGSVTYKGFSDGHKLVCMEEPYKPVKNHCNVLSFGISTDWSFDDAMDNYGCQVYSFDPTIGRKRFDRSANIHFYPIGLAGKKKMDPKRRTFITYRDVLKQIGLEGEIIDYVKIDIEGTELETMDQIIREDRDLLMNVKQLSMEIHPSKREADRDKVWHFMHMLECFNFKLIFYEKNKFELFKYKNNKNFESCCYELVWINQNIVSV